MKLVDDIYNTYKYHFSADEEDVYPVVYGLIECKTKEELFTQLEDLPSGELSEMVTLFVLDRLQQKLVEEGIGQVTLGQDYTGDSIH